MVYPISAMGVFVKTPIKPASRVLFGSAVTTQTPAELIKLFDRLTQQFATITRNQVSVGREDKHNSIFADIYYAEGSYHVSIADRVNDQGNRSIHLASRIDPANHMNHINYTYDPSRADTGAFKAYFKGQHEGVEHTFYAKDIPNARAFFTTLEAKMREFLATPIPTPPRPSILPQVPDGLFF